jgi:alpha-glucosidase
MAASGPSFIQDSNHCVRVQWLAENAVRITHSGSSSDPGDFPPDRPWLRHVLLPQSEVSPDRRELQVDLSAGRVQIYTREGKLVLAEARPPRFGRNEKVSLSLLIKAGEGFYGWGEWFNAFQRKRGALHVSSHEAVSLLQNIRTYSGIPFFLSTTGYGFFLLNSYTSKWQIKTSQGVLDITSQGPPADYILIYGPAFKEIIRIYTALTGRPPLLPRWAFGLWGTGYPQESQEKVIAHVRRHRKWGTPLDVVILDYHWEERFHNFQWRPSLFPEPERLIAELESHGVHLGLIFTPFLNTRNLPLQKIMLKMLKQDIPRGMLAADERALPEFEQARSQGYLAHEDVLWWFGRGGMVDFTNPEAARWWNSMLRRLYDQGVAFFKNDDGEYLPGDSHSALGMRGREYHNLYGFFYGKAISEGMAELDDRRPMIYARSVWAGSQHYPALFMGDQNPTFNFLKRTLRAGLNLGLMGFAYWTADIFGLEGKTSPETHMRYAQWTLFAPVARYFWRPAQVDRTRYPWSHGPQAEASFQKHVELRYRLLPYYYALAWQAYQTGISILRPLILEFQDSTDLRDVYDQVMLGDRLMLCPVVESGADCRKVHLPPGTWHDFWSEGSWEGPAEIELPAPIDRLPILVRGGTILPMGPSFQHIPDKHRFDRLQLHCWPPYPARGLIYDDDGCTRAYQRGDYSTTEILLEDKDGGLSISIAAASGSFPGQYQSRQVEVILHRASRPAKISLNDQTAVDWEYDASLEQTSLSLECPLDQETQLQVFY